MSTATNDKQRGASTPSNGHWTAAEATEHYDVARWGQGYFSVNESGHLQVHPSRDAARAIDLKQTGRPAATCAA